MAFKKRKRSTLSPHPHRGLLKKTTTENTVTGRNSPGDGYDTIVHHLEAETKKVSENRTSKPFLETGLGGLAPEIREVIFKNLLAVPPPYGGRDFRVEQTPIVGRPPISLTAFVDLKSSCLAVLQTCRQVYFEAFSIFYAGKSYYLANSQDLATCFEIGRWLRVGPRSFRVDTITSLCLKNLVIKKPKWKPQQIENLISQQHTLNREELEAERTEHLDFQLVLVDLEDMKRLRKICLCMLVGQEWEYLRFLFRIKGLRRGVITFIDNFHWSIRSQSEQGDDWSLQYAAFPSTFYRKGKNFEILEYHDVSIQGEVLDIDSRASDLDEGDERWVEVNIGSRNYEERMPEQHHAPDVVMAQMSETQHGLPSGESLDLSTDDGSDHGSEQLQRQLDEDTDGTQTNSEPDQEFYDPQEQPDAEESGTQTDYEQDQESMDLQIQWDGDNNGAKTDDEPDPESGGPQDLEDDDRVSYAEVDIDLFQFYEFVSGEESEGDLEAQQEGNTQATTELSFGIQHQDYRNAQVQTEPDDSGYRNAETQTEPKEFLEDLQEEDQMAITPAQTNGMPKQGTMHQSKVPLGQRGPAQSKLKPFRELQDSAKSQPDLTIAMKSLQPVKDSLVPQKPKALLAAMDNSPTPKAQDHFPLTSYTMRCLHRCVRAAALTLALGLFYMILYGRLENTLGQLFALLFSVLLLFVTLWSESD